MLELSHLERTYNGVGGVTDVSLTVPDGAIYALCGANGAGKTTVLSVVCGLLFAKKGSLRLRGEDVPLDRFHARHGLGWVGHDPAIDPALNGWQWAAFVRGVKAVHWPASALESALRLGLTVSLLDQSVGTLSQGNRRKVVLWVELMTTSALLVMDEPLVGLDPPGIQGFNRLCREFVADGRSILMSTHLLGEAEATATHVGILQGGKLQTEGELQSILVGRTLHQAFSDTLGTLDVSAEG